ncbi:MAG TPA: sigma-70 family RNA polymerase sigma factor [Gemmataceae bacterium]|nr:sigma-70 family RNA polymerase sigma factor [Gemmataceae bacterium]
MDTELRERRKAEFAERLREAQSRLFGYIHSLVRDLDDADDLFQQTTLILWNKFDDFDASRSFLSWACGVARLEVCNFLRSRGRQRLYFSDDLNLLLAEAQDETTHDETEERRTALAGCVEKLRQRDRELLDECYGREGGMAEVAGRHGRSSQSVHNSLRRIRRSLFECIRRTLDQRSRPRLIG